MERGEGREGWGGRHQALLEAEGDTEVAVVAT